MGFEITNTETSKVEITPTPSQEDIIAALDLIEENPTLRNHPAVLKLIENNFITDDGRQLDPGNYLSDVLAKVNESMNTESAETTMQRIDRIMNSIVVHSAGTHN